MQRATLIANRWSKLSLCKLQFPPIRHGFAFNRFSSSQRFALDTSLLYGNEERDLKPDVLNGQLCQLVKEGRYGAANRIRLQMTEHEIEIEQNPVYEEAAHAVLLSKAPEKAIEDFTAWFSLVPDADHPLARPSCDYPFRRVYTLLFKTGTPSKRLPIIIRFGLITAAKGYHRYFVPQIARLIVGFGSADEIKDYFVEAENEALQYAIEYRHGDIVTAPRVFRQIGVEMCAEAKRFEEAVFLLLQERKYTLPDRTYQLLLGRMKSSEKNLSQLIALVEESQRQDTLERNLHPLRHLIFDDDVD